MSKELPVIGILGDGQLSAMMTEAYQAIGGRTHVLGATPEAEAHQLANESTIADMHSLDDLMAFFPKVDVVTIENEFIDSAILISASKRTGVKVIPEPEGYSAIEDKLSENRFFDSMGAKQADYLEVTCADDLPDTVGYLKLAKGGYDGIGTYRVESKEQAADLFEKMQSQGVVLFEKAVDFKKEVSLVVAKSGEQMAFYPLVETHQDAGTCRYVSLPAGVSEEVQAQAQEMVGKIMLGLGCDGLFAFELFLTNDDELLVNESAPRPHNSGHITIDLADCSQFENHMRAVAGLELKQPKLRHPSGMMINLLATREGPFDERRVYDAINDDQTTVRLYGKKQTRIKRKMGHINIWGDDLWDRAKKLTETIDI